MEKIWISQISPGYNFENYETGLMAFEVPVRYYRVEGK